MRSFRIGSEVNEFWRMSRAIILGVVIFLLQLFFFYFVFGLDMKPVDFSLTFKTEELIILTFAIPITLYSLYYQLRMRSNGFLEFNENDFRIHYAKPPSTLKNYKYNQITKTVITPNLNIHIYLGSIPFFQNKISLWEKSTSECQQICSLIRKYAPTSDIIVSSGLSLLLRKFAFWLLISTIFFFGGMLIKSSANFSSMDEKLFVALLAFALPWALYSSWKEGFLRNSKLKHSSTLNKR